jgi:hypothetical protein
VEFPTFIIDDRIYNPITNENESIRNVYKTITIKSQEVTETNDGLDEWLIGVKNQGHDELYIHEIVDCPPIYNPMTFEPMRYKLINYFSRKSNPKINHV